MMQEKALYQETGYDDILNVLIFTARVDVNSGTPPRSLNTLLSKNKCKKKQALTSGQT